MKDRYTLKSAVFLLLTKKVKNEEYILLQRRFNTGLLDGQYDVSVSGHLEKGETLREAMIREAKEEIGIDIEIENLKYVSTMHAQFKDSEYLFIIFNTDKYNGIPTIMENDKCDDLLWVNIKKLPNNIILTREKMISDYLNNNFYSEYLFNEDI